MSWKTGVLVGSTLVFIMMMTAACSSKPASFADQWAKAAAAKDGAAAWKLVPAETRTRMLAALDKGRERAATDPPFARLRTALLAPIDPTLPSQALAEQSLSRQLVVGPTPAPAAPATTFATMVHADGAAAGILWHPPLGGEPVPLPAASAKSARQPITVDPASLTTEPMSQRTIQQKNDAGRWVITLLLETASGKTVKYVKFYQDNPDEWMETDVAGHRIVVRNQDVLSELKTTDDNSNLHPDNHIKRYKVTGPGLEVEKVWTHTHYIKDGVPYAEEPDSADRNVFVVYQRKATDGADVSKLSADDLRKLASDESKMVNGEVVAYDVEGRTDGEEDYRKATARIAERAELPPWTAGALTASMIALDGAVGHDGVTHVRFRVTPGAEPKLTARYTTAAGEKTVDVAFTTI